MKTRHLAGYACVAIGFAMIAMLGYGVIEPIGAAPTAPSSLRELLLSLAPSVGIALVAFLLGLWLLKGKRTP